jgi:hypothetical protein
VTCVPIGATCTTNAECCTTLCTAGRCQVVLR